MRTVLKSHSEVAHIWAQQTQSEGRASNIFFDGVSIFSYGRHFEIARFISPDVVFFTTRDYSSSTGKHKSRVRRAIIHKTVFEVPSMDDHETNVRYYVAELYRADKQIKASVKRARSYYLNLRDAQTEMQRYLSAFSKFLTLEQRKLARKELADSFKWKYTKELARSDMWCAKEEEVRAERERKRELLDAERIEKWKAGDPDIRSVYTRLPILRVKGDKIQTSHGAEVPLEGALALFTKIKNGESVHGIALGDYTVTGFVDGILTVGCHKLALSEMERVARELGI